MTKAYKLTDKYDLTYNGTQWGVGIQHTASGEGTRICSPDLIHFYMNKRLALLWNPIHGNLKKPHLWECVVSEPVVSDGTKYGTKSLTTVRRIRKPTITLEHKVRWAILCAAQVYHNTGWIQWAQRWLDNTDRTAKAADAAYTAARAVYAKATRAASAANAADAAADAAAAAASAAAAAANADAAYTAAYTATSAAVAYVIAAGADTATVAAIAADAAANATSVCDLDGHALNPSKQARLARLACSNRPIILPLQGSF